MRSTRNQVTRLISALSRVVLAVAALPTLVHGQISASSQQPFAGIDESLVHKADALLVRPTSESQTVMKPPEQKAGAADAPRSNSADRPRAEERRASLPSARLEQIRPLVTPILEQEGVPSELCRRGSGGKRWRSFRTFIEGCAWPVAADAGYGTPLWTGGGQHHRPAAGSRKIDARGSTLSQGSLHPVRIVAVGACSLQHR